MSAAAIPQRPSRLLLYGMGLGSVLSWGASFPITKAALAFMGPTSVAFLRWSISAILLAAALTLAGRRNRSQGLGTAVAVARAHTWTVVWVSLTGISLFYFLQNLALRYTTAINAGVLANLTSVFMVLIGAWILHERLRGVDWVALGAAFLGSALVSQGAGHLTLGGTGLLGDALMVLASFLGAVYSIGAKGLSERYPPLVVLTLIAVVGALFLLPLALIEGLTLGLPARAWALVGLLGVGSGVVGNFLWLGLLRSTPASRAALVLLLVPVVSAALAVILLGEPVSLMLVIGTALVLGGVFLAQRRSA